MTAQKHRVALGESEVLQLKTIIRKGVSKTRVITRARVLLMANETYGTGKKDEEIMKALDISRSAVQQIRKRSVVLGLKYALYDAPRPGKERVVTGKDEAEIISIACTDPPDGYDHWTLDLLKEEITGKNGKNFGRSTVYRVLLRNELKPWREKNLVHKDKR